MAYSSPSTFEAAGGARTQPIRLAYDVAVLGRGAGYKLEMRRVETNEAISENELLRLQDRLHALDLAIFRELRMSTVFGQLGDPSIARVLPLLAQRKTRVNGQRLRILEVTLKPRIYAEPTKKGGLRVMLSLQDERGEQKSLTDGRLLAGSQAFFLVDHRAFPVESPAPWELQRWSRDPYVVLEPGMGASSRDHLTRELRKAGISEEDLEALAVQREPPRAIVVTFEPLPEDAEEPTVYVHLEADYGSERSPIHSARPADPYVRAADGHSMLERDIVAEESARREIQGLGFKFDKAESLYVARGEAALRAMDPNAKFFPSYWVIDRGQKSPRFYHDLDISAEVALLEERSLLDLRFELNAVGDDDTAVEALIDMKDLLQWLSSGRKYVRLADGSFVAPSASFRKRLSVLEDLGASSDRVLVSPLCVGLLQAIGDKNAVRAADEATRAWLAELSGESAPEEIEPPEAMKDLLRDYQRRGLDWLSMLHRHKLTGILADDMGLGKTVQGLALLANVRKHEGPMPALVVAPTSVTTVWRDEAERFLPEFNVVLWAGPPNLRRSTDVSTADLVVTSYGILRRDVEILSRIAFRYVLLDEAQSAKNASSQNARAVRQLKSQRRLALTGTPIENRPDELWSVFDFLAPGFLGNLRQFRTRYARPIERGESEAKDLLRSRVRPLILRRLKSEVARDLPEKMESVLRCDMLPAQQALYDHVAGELREGVRKKIEKVGIEKAHLDILAALTRLRQICCDPALIPAPADDQVPGSAKLELFEEVMREALEGEHRVVVFSQFVEMQKRLIAVLKTLGIDPLWLHGGTRHRDKVVANFQDPSGPPVIVVSLRAGGTGLTLTRADTVVHYDPWWNPAVEQQATDRAHRLGQDEQVNVYRLVCRNSIEERVLDLAKSKQSLARDLLGSEGVSGAKHITAGDIFALLG